MSRPMIKPKHFLFLSVISASAALAAQLDIPEGEEVLRVSRLIRADGRPAIYCIDYLPVRMIVNPDLE